MEDNSKNIFYVYAYLDPRKPGPYKYGDNEFSHEPFYIGKGHGSRCTRTTKRSVWVGNKLGKFKRNGLKVIIIKIAENLCEEDAYKLEIKTIKHLGRCNLETGPLVNLTDGGDGLRNPSQECRQKMSEIRSLIFRGKGNPFYGKKHTKETRKKISESLMGNVPYNKGQPMSESQKKKLSKANTGKHLSEEGKQKLRDHFALGNHPFLGRKHSEEAKRKVSETKKRQARSHDVPYQWIAISPKGVIHQIRNLTQFCENYLLNRQNMYRVARGVRPHHKKWKCYRMEVA